MVDNSCSSRMEEVLEKNTAVAIVITIMFRDVLVGAAIKIEEYRPSDNCLLQMHLFRSMGQWVVLAATKKILTSQDRTFLARKSISIVQTPSLI